MCIIHAFILCLTIVQCSSVFANSGKDVVSNVNSLKEEIGFNSFKELGQAFDEQMSIISEIFDQTAQGSLANAYKGNQSQGGHAALDVKVVDNKVEISVKVPLVENSEAIKAHVNAARTSLKVIVPQKEYKTKVVIESLGDQTSIKKVTQQLKKESHEGKNLHSFHMSSSKQVVYKTLPFAVDLNDRTVEYKDNDILTISLNKVQTPSLKKAQPRVIPVTNK